MPKVSFVIPVYEGDAYLAETIESIRRQSMKDIEIVVIDDCSPDFTSDLMDWYMKFDERIKYERLSENIGVCEARNYGNRKAQSELICVSDQDDLSAYHRASYSYTFFKHRPEFHCLTSSYCELSVDGLPIKKQVITDPMDRAMFDKGEGNYVWFHSSACYRKEDALKIPYRKVEGATDDHIFLDDWTKANMKFYSTKKILANCRRLPWGVMQQRRKILGWEPSYYL